MTVEFKGDGKAGNAKDIQKDTQTIFLVFSTLPSRHDLVIRTYIRFHLPAKSVVMLYDNNCDTYGR